MEVPKIFRDDQIINETEEDSTPLDITKESRKVESKSLDVPIDVLDKWFRDGKLIVRPDFQREFVWDAKKINRLIESVFLDFPIPVIYLVEEEDSKLTVIDGQQRICSLLKFIQNKHQLKNLAVCTELNGKTWKQLSEDQQRQFQNFSLSIVKITKNSHKDIRFEIFERLNTGSVKLNDQEIRNCIYRGKYNELLKELAENDFFQYILNSPNLQVRMLDVELVLRFFAFYNKTHLKYKAPMKQFLNNEIGSNKQISPEKISELTAVFKKSVDLIRTIFGDMAFRRMTPGNENDPNGSYRATSFNQGLYDILMNGFTNYEKSQVIPFADAIREELFFLMAHDQKFIDAISGTGTDSTDKVKTKFKIWIDSLENLLGSPRHEPRGFTRELKHQLFQSNPTCAICNQRIALVDDAEIDHIDFYWRGGATIPGNARLTHRYCNRKRGGGDKNENFSIPINKTIPQIQEPKIKELQTVTQPHDTPNYPSIDRIQHPLLISHIPGKEQRVQDHGFVKPSRNLFKAKINRTFGAISRKHYIFPMLEYLFQHGPIKNKQAYPIIEEQFKDEFTHIDTDNLEQDPSLRWKKNLDYAKYIMRDNGLLKNNIRSVWELTDSGKEFYLMVKDNPDSIDTKKEGTRDIITFDNRDIRDIITFDKK